MHQQKYYNIAIIFNSASKQMNNNKTCFFFNGRSKFVG